MELNACFVSKKKQAANNGTLISRSDYEKNIFKIIVDYKVSQKPHKL